MADLDSIKRYRDLIKWHRVRLNEHWQSKQSREETHRIPYNHYRRQLRKEMIKLVFGA